MNSLLYRLVHALTFMSTRQATTAAALGVLLAAGSVSSAGTVTIEASARGFVEDTNGDGVPDRQQLSSIVVRRFPTVGAQGIDNRGIAEFDLAGIIGTPQVVTSASLVLTAFDNQTITPVTPNGISITPGFNLQLYGYAGDGSVNFASDWGAGTFLTSQVLDGLTTTVSFDATNLVIPLLNANTRFVGVNMRTDFNQAIGSTPFAQFRSGPSGVSPRLELTVEPIPEPTSLALLGVGGISLLVRRQRFAKYLGSTARTTTFNYHRSQWEAAMNHRHRHLLLVVGLILAAAIPASAQTISIDPGDVSEVFEDRNLPFTELNGQALDGSTLDLDFVFADMKHLEANVPADSVLEISVRLNHSGGLIIPSGANESGFLSDEFGNNILDPDGTFPGVANGAISFGLDFVGGINELIFHDVHFTLTLPNAAGVNITGGVLQMDTTCDICADPGDLTVGTWIPEPTSLALLIAGGLVLLPRCRVLNGCC